MRITVNGRNIEITDAIKAYAEEKIGKVAQNHTAEVLCKFVSGSVKAEESAETMYASIDLVADKLNRQVKKFKEKQIGSSKTASIRTDLPAEEVEEEKVAE